LTRTGTGVYSLALNGISSNGTVTVSVIKQGYNISGGPKQAAVYYAVPAALVSLTADGSITATTTKLTLVFDTDIDGLTADDILLDPGTTGALKGNLSRISTGMYDLTLNGTSAAGEIGVQVSKAGYDITDASRTVVVHYTYTVIINVSLQSDWDIVDQFRNIQKNTTTVFTTKNNYVSYQWYLDGTPAGTSSSYIFNSPGMRAGDVYELAVVVTDSAGDKRSGRCRITITN
jgi:hypothetical protein